MHLASWANISWEILKTQSAFIRKCFDATVLVAKDGSNRLRMKRLGRPYSPVFF